MSYRACDNDNNDVCVFRPPQQRSVISPSPPPPPGNAPDRIHRLLLAAPGGTPADINTPEPPQLAASSRSGSHQPHSMPRPYPPIPNALVTLSHHVAHALASETLASIRALSRLPRPALPPERVDYERGGSHHIIHPPSLT